MMRVPNIAKWGVFASSHIFMLATVAVADSTSTVRKKYSVFIYSEGEPHAMYAKYKQTRTLCVLQYAGRPSILHDHMPAMICNIKENIPISLNTRNVKNG